MTTTEPNVTLQQPIVVTSYKAQANSQVLKVTLGGQGQGPAEKRERYKAPKEGKM